MKNKFTKLDELAFEIYKNEHIVHMSDVNTLKTLIENCKVVTSSYIDFSYFMYNKDFYKKYYDKALIIERQNRINKLL